MIEPVQTLAALESRRQRGRELLIEARRIHRDARREAARLMGPMAETSDPEAVLKQFERAIRRLVQAEDASR